MDSDVKIAEIILEPETGSVKHIALFSDDLRFKCQCCATLCCKLGGPRLSSTDVERLQRAGLADDEFVDKANKCMQNTASGACVLLEFDSEKQSYTCKVYRYRPTMCRLYPFHVEKASSNRFVIRLLPCKGVSHHVGAVIDERFLTDNVLSQVPQLARHTRNCQQNI